MEVCGEKARKMVDALWRQETESHIARKPIWNPHRWTLEICAFQRRNLADTLRKDLASSEELL